MNFRKEGKFAASVVRPKTKSASASLRHCPSWFPDHGLCPWTPLEALPPHPCDRRTLPCSPWSCAPQILHPRNDLYGVRWDVKPSTLTHPALPRYYGL